VETGHYNSASEVVKEAIRLMNERDQMKAMQKEEIRKKIAAGLSSAQAGRMSDGDVFMAQMETELSGEIDHSTGSIASQSARDYSGNAKGLDEVCPSEICLLPAVL
jgi:antitoxin ParD1/3/4